MGMEMQLQPASDIHIDHNSYHDPTSPFFYTFGISNACCDTGATSPSTTNIDNVLIADAPPVGGTYIGMADEAWGDGAIYQNNLVQGYWANGFEWAYIPSGNITNNTICGPVLAANDSFVKQETTPATGPAIATSPNEMGANCSAIISTAPAIAQTATAVTLSDSGMNHSIYYTVDGSTPTPYSKLYTAPFSPAKGATVKAVGMWGAANQPKSYPAGFGYVPSATVSAVFKGAVGLALVSAYLSAKGGATSMTVGSTLQFTVYGVYSNGSVAALPDAEGDVVTAWNTSNHAVAKISSHGHVTAMGVGAANIEAMIGTLKASPWEVTVRAASVPGIQAAFTTPFGGSVPVAPGEALGDNFLGPFWELVTPAGGSASISNGHLFLGVPGGSNHDPLVPWNQAVRVVQAIGNDNFNVSIKIDSSIVATDAETSQGLMVLSDNDDFITFALTTDGTNIGLIAHTVTAGVATTLLDDTDFNQYQNPMYLRLTRTGSAYTAFYSTDGAHWTQATSFTYAKASAFIGPFASNYNSTPANAVPVVMSVDWFDTQ